MTLSASIRAQVSPRFSLDIELSASPGVTMIFGASGSGKTTLLRCLAGLLRPDAGFIAIGDRVLFDAARGVDVAVPARRIGYVFQHLALFPHMTVRRNLEYGLAGTPEAVIDRRTLEIAESFRISHLLGRLPRQISGGEQQRAALARSLVTDPDLLLLDEPLSALDRSTQSRIIADLRGWNRARSIPILYVTHSHREVFALGERVLVVQDGRVIGDGTPHDVLEVPVEEPIAQLAGFENFFDATVEALKAGAGTMQCRLESGGAELEVPLTHTVEGGTVRVAIRASDIIVATEQPRGLSARNVLPGFIRGIEREGTTVGLDVDAGVMFRVNITPGALDALGLAIGSRVWMIVKTHSCRIVSSEPGRLLSDRR